jgi:hypothetical protein
MAFTLEHLEIDDYDAWKREIFDKDPARRREIAKRHQIFRGVEDPRQVFIGVEFESADDATSFRERLLASGALEGIKVKMQATVVEVADTAEY